MWDLCYWLQWGQDFVWSEGRKGDAICHEGCSTESVKNSVNHFKPLSGILPGLLFPALWFAYLLCLTCSFRGLKLISLMLKELQPYMYFLHWETVSKNQKRRVREQMCLNMCLGFISCPERTPKRCPSTGPPMSICRSESPHFFWEVNSSTSISLSFSLQSCLCPLVLSLLFWPGSGEAWAMAAPASCP